jgi:hypothetical protein
MCGSREGGNEEAVWEDLILNEGGKVRQALNLKI